MTLLEGMQTLARWLRPLRVPVTVLGVLALVAAVYLVLFVEPDMGDRLLLPTIAGLVWCLVALLFITTFEQVPPRALPSESRWAKLKRGAERLWYRVLALTLIGLSLAALLLSKRLIGEALG